ncbi:hypothetical protein M433DRAFT_291075 [Acidomyces richmondensis BFW]|nr:MAG: hypothetical protein FE78DRAFT_33812 [Acidomyces sp. 'richmondensis']KYG49539.1 hypothetical protein M433DRAFT_291075 [Acidomyces richmondensis BFW]
MAEDRNQSEGPPGSSGTDSHSIAAPSQQSQEGTGTAEQNDTCLVNLGQANFAQADFVDGGPLTSEETRANTESDFRNPSSSPQSSPASKPAGSTRRSSSKIANLRAAFEKNATSSDNTSTKRRFPSGERKSDRDAGREREYWKEIARLRDERDKEAALRVEYEDKCTALEAIVEDLRLKIEVQETGTVSNRSVAEDEDGHRQGIDAVKQKTEVNEIQRLEQQIADLKRTISTSTRMETVVSDSALAQEMEMLNHELQNWIVNNFRKAKGNVPPEELCSRLERVAVAKDSAFLKPMYAAFDPAAKLAIYQTTATYYIMDIFNSPLLFGMSDDQEWQINVRQAAKSLSAVLGPETYNKWRAITLDAVRYTDSLQEVADVAGSTIVETICKVLSAVTEFETTDARRISLNGIVKKAISLAHMFQVQRAQYEFHLPIPGAAFEPATMDDLSTHEDAENRKESIAKCATFPLVTKVGNEYGGNLLVRNVVVKAKVLCGHREP